MTMHDPVIVSVHPFRRTARKEERRLQRVLDAYHEVHVILDDAPADLPLWAHGVRVERAGAFQHAVVATERRGH
jgi:hypothetical protein